MPTLKVTLFGVPQIERDGERIVPDTRKALALLAYLAINQQPHSRETLAALFWPESPTNKAFNNLRQTLWVLRKYLTDTWLDVDRQTVAIKQAPSLWIDVCIFHQHLEAAADHNHAASTACAQCLPSLVAALEVYANDFLRGFTLPDCPGFDDWQSFQTDMLREKLIECLKKVVRYYASSHDVPQAIQYARQWLTRCPWEEEGHRELMRLYPLNRQRSVALQQYDECARMLKQEFGVEPDHHTKELYEAILHRAPDGTVREHNGNTFTQEQKHTSSLPTEISRQNMSVVPGGPLYYQPTPFIGRQREVDAITQLLRQPDCRMLTLSGLGGIGKTRLAQQIMPIMFPHYPDGVYFLELAAVPSPEELLPALTAALNISPSPEKNYCDAFFQYLSDKRLLLILDNFEHLLSGTGLMRDILRCAPEVRLLFTSQARLNLMEEWVYDVSGMEYASDAEYPEAVQFFVHCARRRHSKFTLTAANTPHILHLCRLVDGLPLALELAASWINLLSCDQIVEEVERSFDFLSSHTSGQEPRHQSLRAVCESSWKRLSLSEQRMACYLSLFQGNFDLHAAHTLTGMALPDVAGLADRSLLQCQANGRFVIHPLLRRFLQEKLQKDMNEYVSASHVFCRLYCERLCQSIRLGSENRAATRCAPGNSSGTSQYPLGLAVGTYTAR